MLIEFRVENHRSLRDEQALTLEAGHVGDASDPRPRSVAGHKKKLLPAAALYGPNASGKSNVLSALAFMRNAVLNSQRFWDPQGGIPRTAFAWAGKRGESSMFEATFLLGETKIAYGFTVNDDVVEEEWIFAWPKGRKQVWFERDADSFTFGEHLKGPNEAVKEVTRPNSLFLSAAAQNGHQQLISLYSWFNIIFPVNVSGSENRAFLRHFIPQLLFSANAEERSFPPDETLDTRIRQLLRSADFGIVDFKKVSEHEFRGQMRRGERLLLQHQADDEDSWLDWEEESEGTKTLFEMAPSVFLALASGGLLLVDELESSLHPSIGLAIVKLFNCPKANPKNAQLVFTTHDTNLLGTTLGEPPLRRDQIWFTEKNAEGASTLYPLTVYKPRRAENLERGYLQGRYGAIPFLGDFSRVTE